jgi:hypothetical protein
MQPALTSATPLFNLEQKMTVLNANPNQPANDINALRLPQNFGQTLGVKKLLTNIPVGKPRSDLFFRVNPDPLLEFKTLIYTDKSTRDTYAVSFDLGDAFGNLAKPVVLHLAVDRRGNPYLIPVILPNESGNRNSWHDSLDQAVNAAKDQWVRISANLSAGVYDVRVAAETLAQPDWPEQSMEQLVAIAFRGKVINSVDHPVIQGLDGLQ